ncbi:MAG: GAF domain-containing protein [Candidatus Limnocylindria bacterium]
MTSAAQPPPASSTASGAPDGGAESLAAIGKVLGAVIHGGFELEPVLTEIAAHSAELCNADYAYVYLRDGDLYRLAADSGGTEAFSQYERQHPMRAGRDSGVGRVALERRVIHISDVLADHEYSWAGQPLLKYRTLLGLPIEVDGDIIGVIGVSRTRVQPFSEAEITTISVFAAQTGVAVRLAGLLGEKHQAVEREAAISQVLQTMGRSSFVLHDVLETVVSSAVTLCRADFGNIVRRDPDRQDLYRVAVHVGFNEAYAALEARTEYTAERGTMIGRALLERRPVQILDVLADPEYRLPDMQEAGQYRTLLGVPMLRDGDPVGMLVLGRTEVRAFSAREISLVSTFADQAVLAIENARLFETVERQRTELARFAPQVASLLSSEEGKSLLAGHRREITALFCDLRGFTAFAETAEPEEVLGLLREYHGAVGELVTDHGGTVEHFAGDGLMVFFNDPTPQPEHRSLGIRTAIAMRERFVGLAERWHRLGYELGLGIGIAVGYATIGRIGFEGRYDYGAVGNVVILASRLSEAASPGQILISQRLFAAVEDEFEAEEVEPISLKGLSRPTAVHSILGARS